MARRFLLLTVICLILFYAGQDVSAQQAAAVPNVPAQEPGAATPPQQPSRSLAEQLRQARATQTQARNRQGGQTLLAMNLTGLETFGDALGGIPERTDTFFVTERFTFNSGMFDGSVNTATNMFRGQLTSLNGGAPVGFSLEFDAGQRVGLTNAILPSGLASDVVAYLGRENRDRSLPVTFSDSLADYAVSHGINPSRLSLDTTDSHITFGATNFSSGQIVYNYVMEYQIPSAPSVIYGLGRQKITENMTPVPTDRLIFDYSFFHNVPLPYGKMPVNRFTPGFEKTFLDKRFSFEMRMPFAATIDSTLYTDNTNRINVLRIGDPTLILKHLAFSGERTAVTLGLAMSVPLADDTNMIDAATGRTVIRMKNESVHLMPYIGLFHMPNERIFWQSYFQIDAATVGDPVYIADISDASGMLYAGRARERTFTYTSLSLGYWLFRKYDRRENLTRGMNVMGELHWTQSIDNATGVRHQQEDFIFDIGSNRNNYTVVNMTLGTRYLFNEKTNIGVGYSVPLRNKNRQFDGELRVALNRYF